MSGDTSVKGKRAIAKGLYGTACSTLKSSILAPVRKIEGKV